MTRDREEPIRPGETAQEMPPLAPPEDGPPVWRLDDPTWFPANRLKYPLEEWWQYAEMMVAWSADGLRIVDADLDADALMDRLQAQGYNLSDFVYERFPPADWDGDV